MGDAPSERSRRNKSTRYTHDDNNADSGFVAINVGGSGNFPLSLSWCLFSCVFLFLRATKQEREREKKTKESVSSSWAFNYLPNRKSTNVFLTTLAHRNGSCVYVCVCVMCVMCVCYPGCVASVGFNATLLVGVHVASHSPPLFCRHAHARTHCSSSTHTHTHTLLL